MNQTHSINLINKTYTYNEIGVPVAAETTTSVFAMMFSVGRTEFFNAGLQGLRPAACFAVRTAEYDGQEEIEYNGERLSVYRTYDRTDGRTELYVNRRKGDDITVTT